MCTDEETDQVSAEGLETGNKLMEILFQKYFEGGANLNYASTSSEGPPQIDICNSDSDTLVKTSSVSLASLFVQSALEAGIPKDKLEVFVADAKLRDEHSSAVLAKDNYAKNQMRVSGVPLFVMESQTTGKKPVVVSGGQPVQAMIGYLRSCAQ